MAGTNTRALVAAGVAGVVFIGAVKYATSRGDDEPDAAKPPRTGCTTVVVLASPDKSGEVTEVAEQYNKSDRMVDGTCYGIDVRAMSSGTAEARLAQASWDQSWGPAPDAWTPAASTWLTLLRHDRSAQDRPDILPAKAESVATTPVVLAMPEPMAKALGWPTTPIGWSDVLALARDPRGWASKGHPEWGAFKLGKTNPNISTSGLAATIGALVAATGTSSDLTLKTLADPKVRAFAAGVEKAVVHYGDNTLTYLTNLLRADDAGAAMSYVSAVAVEEKSVIDYNLGNPSHDPKTLGQHGKPRVPLVAVYPKEGTLYSDNPYAVLEASWSDAGRKAGAADFLAFMREPAQQKRFTDAGLRTHDFKPGKALLESDKVIPDGVKITLTAPGPSVLAAVRATWMELRKRAHVLLVLDVSGSMGEAAGQGNKTKLELAQAAAVNGLTQLSDTDEVGLWTFTTNVSGPNTFYKELLPVRPLGPQRQQMIDSIKALEPLSGTPLYASIRAAADFIRANPGADAINAVVVLTDGKNDYAPDNDLDGLVRQLTAQASEGGTRVFSIAYGKDADLNTLKSISEATRAAAYDATNPQTIEQVFTNVLSNF